MAGSILDPEHVMLLNTKNALVPIFFSLTFFIRNFSFRWMTDSTFAKVWSKLKRVMNQKRNVKILDGPCPENTKWFAMSLFALIFFF